MITADERNIIRRVLDHVAAGTTDMVAEPAHNPIGRYTDPDQHRREVDVLFRNFPLAIAHVSELAEPGDFVTHDDTGVPLLVTRTESGEIRAFVNVCRHRGARIEHEPCGHARRFTCPYHSWSYDLDGALRGMPQPVGFEGIDRAALRLVEVPAFERFGLVWVVPSPQDHDIDVDTWLSPLAEQLHGLDLGRHVIFRKWALHKEMSWRLALEGFQESYHFCSAHRHTACSNYLDNQSVWDDYRPHVRHSVPLPHITRLADQPEDQWEYRPYFMTQNFVFPANFVQAMTDHVYVHTILPTGPGRCAFHCMMLVPDGSTSDKSDRYWEKNYDVVRTVFDEDFALGEGIQRGFAAGVNDHLIFGRYECGLHFGQRSIDEALAGTIRL